MLKEKTMAIFIGSIIAPALGQWVDLPTAPENISAVIKQVQTESGAEETIISDHEYIDCSEYDNPYTVNATAAELEKLDDEERDVYEIMTEECGYSHTEALEAIADGRYRYYYNAENMEDVAWEIVEECGLLANVPEEMQRYFDYEAYGRDLDIEGHFYTVDKGIIEIF